MGSFRITISCPPDRNDLVADVIYDHYQWAEINQEEGNLVVQFYSYPEIKNWEFKLDDALEALNKAKEKLLSMGPKNNSN